MPQHGRPQVRIIRTVDIFGLQRLPAFAARGRFPLFCAGRRRLQSCVDFVSAPNVERLVFVTANFLFAFGKSPCSLRNTPPFTIRTIVPTLTALTVRARLCLESRVHNGHLHHGRHAAARAATHDLVLDGGHDLFIEKVLIDGQQANERYQMSQGQLTIKNISKQSTVTIVNRIVPVNNTSLSGIYMSRGAFMSQCRSSRGFRNITYWPDRLDNMMVALPSRFTPTRRSTPFCFPTAIWSPGDEADNRHWVRWEDPIKTVLPLCLVAGQFVAREDKIKTRRPRSSSAGLDRRKKLPQFRACARKPPKGHRLG